MRLLFVLILILPDFVAAGGGSGRDGGGIAVVCKKGPADFWKFSGKTFLADTFSMLAKTSNGQKAMVIRSNTLSEAAHIEYFLRALEKNSPFAANTIRDRLTTLKFTKLEKVPELDASKFDMKQFEKINPLIPKLCSPVQLAIQDRETREILVNESLYDALSNSEKALFKIHEAYVTAGNEPGNSPIHDTLQRIIDYGWSMNPNEKASWQRPTKPSGSKK